MPRFSANISMLFTELDELARPAAAAAAGFGAVEMQFPYDRPVGDWAAAIGDAGLGVSVLNVPAGDMMAGGPGLAAMPGREAAFAAAVEAVLPWAEALRPSAINVLAGYPPGDLGRDRCLAVLAGNLALAADSFAPLGVRAVVEAINTVDRPGFFIASSAQALEALDLAGHPNLGMEFDIYHMHMMGEEIVPTLERILPRIGHIQFADSPGRHEPGTGEIDFPAVFAALDRLGWDGWVAAEYAPSRPTPETLGWLARFPACGG